MKKLLLMMIVGISALSMSAENVLMASPDGKLQVTVSEENGKIGYTVDYDGTSMLQKSALGLKTNIGNYEDNLTIKEVRTSHVDHTYTLTQSKASQVHVVANEWKIDCVNGDGLRMTITFHISNNDIAYRYTLSIPERGRLRDKRSAVVTSEATTFNLADGTTTFLCPQIKPGTGWMGTKPSYEEEYKPDMPMTQKSAFGCGYTFPCLFKVGTAGWVLVSETGVGGDYCASHLSDYQQGKGYGIASPDPNENGGIGSVNAAIPLPGSTPWRTITVGSSLKPIVETTIPFDVVEPRYEPSQVYQPGRYTWSWLIWQDNSCNYDDQVQFVDLAATMGYEYVLVDALWDTQIGREKIEQLSKYAQQKGVALMLWYNSNGVANDAPQGPKNCLNTSIARNKEMAWMKRIGVKGIKVDFFGGDKQETMRLYEDILADANRYGIQVIFHGCTLPRGWERMYPNYVASEAVLASENVFFSDYHAKQEAKQLTMHPFSRNAVAAMDWGGTIMNKYLSRDNKSRHARTTTDVFEIAAAIVNQTSIQCIAIYPNNLSELPQSELDLLKRIPTTWDETVFIDGYPMQYVLLARRHGNEWWIAGLNAGDAPLTLNVDLPMLAGKTAECFTDKKAAPGEFPDMQASVLKVNKKGKAKITLQPNGGTLLIGQ